MKTTKYKGLLSVLIIAIMIMTATQPLIADNSGVESANSPIDGAELEAYNVAINPVTVQKEDLYSKNSYISIIVATSDIGELATLLSKCEYNGLIGTQSSNTKGLAFPILEVPEDIIPEIEMLSHVYGIYDYNGPIATNNFDYQDELYSYSVPQETDGIIENKMNIEHASYYHGAEEAWDNGYTGDGVNIAAVTAGVDFGHYELNGRQAIDTDASSPYYNYPIAFDSTSMAAYFEDGLPLSYETPGDTWYVNTSSTDLDVYHTIIIDGVNDFWDEKNVPKTIDTYYNMSLTTDLKGKDIDDDMKGLEFNLDTLNVASDIDNWYVGFSVSPEVESEILTWKRTIDVKYGLYIDTVAGGATTDPLGNFMDQSKINFVESEVVYGIVEVQNDDTNPFYLDYNGIINCTLYRWNMSTDTTTKLVDGTDYALNYTNGEINTIDYLGSLAIGDLINATYNYSHKPEYAIYIHHTGVKWGVDSDGEVWTENNTLEDADFYSWDGAEWNEEELINLTNKQAFGGDFVEFPIPKVMLDNATSMSAMLFSVGDNKSHAQDTVPDDDNVSFMYPDWGATTTTLANFTFINEPVEYIVEGIPSASGEYHIGLHPDQSLINNYYGRPAAVLLTDYYDSGVYDAVYVDLDNDKCFTDEIPMQQYGAYNYSEEIGPRFGFERQTNNTVLKDGEYYPIQVKVINEVLSTGSAGNEWNFTLANQNITTAPTLQRNYTTIIDSGNETSYVTVPADDGLEVTFYTDHTPLVDLSLYLWWPGDGWYSFEQGVDYFVDLPTGEITTNLGGAEAGWEFYLYYNYTENATSNPTYTLDAATGELMLDAPLATGDDLVVLDYSYRLTNINQLPSFIHYDGQDIGIELRDWTAIKDVDSDGGTGDGENYQDISGGMVYFIGRKISIFGETLESNKIGMFENEYVTEDSLTVYLNGIELDANGNYTMEYLAGKLIFDYNITVDDVVTVDYAYRNPIPYSETFWDRNGIEEEDQRIPGNGEMIAFFGEYTLDSTQGTQVGSTICGMGTGVDNKDNVLIKGMAPEAKLISIRSGNPFEDWYFAVEGYDGEIASGDEAQIVSISNNFGVQETGWDIYTKAADYIGTYYAQGNAIFIAGVGDNGNGYGTASSPGSSDAVITVGVGTQFDYRNYKPNAPGDLARVYADGGPNPHHGDVLPASSRGPNMMGQPEPDVITAGAFLFASLPLNADQDYTTPAFDWFGGKWAWDLISGSFVSSTSTAGMMALIYDAYYEKHNTYPNAEQARSLIRSGADNMNYDILVQGAGYTNADRSTKMAADLDGIYLNDTFWVPGDYRGTRYEGFAKLSTPGDTYNENFVLSNKNLTDNATIEVYDAVYDKFDSLEIPFNVTKTYDVKDIPGVINIEPLIPIGTELMKVTITSERKETMLNYMGELFDWTDANENGEMDFPDEQNRMVYTIGTNHLELRYRDPLGRVHDGLSIQVKDFGGTGEALTDWTIHLDFYEKIDWDWLTLSNTPTTVLKGEETSFDATLSIPDDAGVGSYDGSIYIKQYAPEELIATGVGEVMENVTFKSWFNPAHGAEGIINDNETTGGDKQIVPKSSLIRWNGSYLYEGVDYYLSGTGGAVKFYDQYPIGNEIPIYMKEFNISYLRVSSINSILTENATWVGQTNISNLVKDDYTLRKDGIIWNETDYIQNEEVINRNYELINETVYGPAAGAEIGPFFLNSTVLNSRIYLSNISGSWTKLAVDSNYTLDNATGELILTKALWAGETLYAYYNYSTAGGMMKASLFNRNIVRRTTTLTLNGTEWTQYGGEMTDSFTMVQNQTEIALTNGNIVPGTSTVMFKGKEMAQTGEVKNTEKEEVQGLNSTSKKVTNEALTVDGAWEGKFIYNSIDKRDFNIISYMIYEDGVALIDGTDFNMHVGGVNGSFRLEHDPTGHTYNASYVYYNTTHKSGQLDHGNIVSESYTVYLNGVVVPINKYDLNESSGMLELTDKLGPDEIIEIAYKYNIYKVDVVSGTVTFSDPFNLNDEVDVIYSFNNYSLDLPTGMIRFSSPLQAGDIITANYSYANFTINRIEGIVMFSNALLPWVNVTIEYSHYLSMIPAFINIGADKPDFTFGGTEQCNSLYNYNEITGGYGSGTGDWRYIYMDITEQGIYGLSAPDEEKEKHRVMVDIDWENDLTDVDVQVFGGRTSVAQVFGESMPSDKYGPHSIRHIGGSDETANFFTTTGVGREIVSPQISSGLNVIGLHTVGFNGSEDHTETYTGRVGTMYIDKPAISVVTNELVGETQINMNSNMEWSGVGGIAGGPSSPKEYKNISITFDKAAVEDYESGSTGYDFPLALASSTYTKLVDIKTCLIFDTHIYGHDTAPDLDLGIFLDGKDDSPLDGKAQSEEFIAYDADMDADEQVKLIGPKDGTYIIKVLGYNVVGTGMFDLDVTSVEGTGFDVQGKGENSLPPEQKGYFSSNQTEMPFNLTHISVSWDLPGSATGTLQGALYLGPGDGPMCMLVPIEITIDRDAPKITDPVPSEGAFVSNTRPQIVVSVSDFDRGELIPSTMRLFVDGNDVTMQTSVSIPFIDDDEAAVQGYVGGTAAYIPDVKLAEGAHVIKAAIQDEAGNEAVKEWTFTVDSSMPAIEITYPSEEIHYTNQDTLRINGQAESGLELNLIGSDAEVIVDENGLFYADVELIDGENPITIAATDMAGNNIEIVRNIIVDNVIPEIETVSFSDGYLTNEPQTTISGTITETGNLLIDGVNVIVNSDGTFQYTMDLIEGLNEIYLEFTDMAGNFQDAWYNVTLDTVAPVIILANDASIVESDAFEVAGNVDVGSEVFVNGKRTTVGTRQSGEFSTTITLSPGINAIVIEAKDGAGNIAEYTHVVEYTSAKATNWGAIGLMITLLVVGLVLGLLFGSMLGSGEIREEPPAEDMYDEEMPEDMPESDMEEGEEMPLDEELPEDGEDMPDEEEIPDGDMEEELAEEGEEIPEDMPDEEEIPDGDMEEELAEEGEELPEDVPLDEEIAPEEVYDEQEPEIPEGAEPIPEEEGLPEELPETEEEPESIDISEEIMEEAPPADEDPRIIKLREAFESGKISEELYQKNLERFQSE